MKRLSIIAVFALAGCGPAFETEEEPAEVLWLDRGEWVAPPPCDITAQPPKPQRSAPVPERRRWR